MKDKKLLDSFASSAMQGLISRDLSPDDTNNLLKWAEVSSFNSTVIAKKAYEMADSMMTERSRRNRNQTP